jgi:hypothetical protein
MRLTDYYIQCGIHRETAKLEESGRLCLEIASTEGNNCAGSRNREKIRTWMPYRISNQCKHSMHPMPPFLPLFRPFLWLFNYLLHFCLRQFGILNRYFSTYVVQYPSFDHSPPMQSNIDISKCTTKHSVHLEIKPTTSLLSSPAPALSVTGAGANAPYRYRLIPGRSIHVGDFEELQVVRKSESKLIRGSSIADGGWSICLRPSGF